MVYLCFLCRFMEDVKKLGNTSSSDKKIVYTFGKYTIKVKRESEKNGPSILESVMNLLYDEMQSRKNK